MAAKPLTEKKLKKFEELIQKELKESVAYVEDINKDQSIGARESSGDLSSYAYHQADQGSDTNRMEQTVMLMEQERDKIRLLNEALRKIYEGNYGVCEMCGDNIKETRLEIIPYAKYCIDCMAKMEDKKRRQKK
ncbi:MAG: TraR/DksA C4-type zinc finger protein [Candidatus Cloacimonetes bacterium]|jgi:RNA polymerase-binding transcription factor DksA|nr:TraR/DksA family transcriptional regulator [Candidatus Cloacimonadota bacterium]MDD4223294.1 TraR/DksA C4-type zinc finger protein [Candidatus Cloacimonadota bacterium]